MVCDGILPPLFDRQGLCYDDWQTCLGIVRDRYRGCDLDAGIEQGGCSYTIKVITSSRKQSQEADIRSPQNETFLIQFRLQRHALSTVISTTAKQWYGKLVASVEEECRFTATTPYAELVAYRMSFLSGKRFDELQPRRSHLDGNELQKCRTLLDGLAEIYATAWRNGIEDEESGARHRCDGKVGSSILRRLQSLAAELPSSRLRETARKAREGVEAGMLDRLPVAFTHGDLLPSNILVNEQTWRIEGLVDWAESEFLPFGMNLYGLEHLLGFDASGQPGVRFVYLREVGYLRKFFWQQLEIRIPALQEPEPRRAVELAGMVGILLWHGFAWDDGTIDRVVEALRDAEELAYLEAFLEESLSGGPCETTAPL